MINALVILLAIVLPFGELLRFEITPGVFLRILDLVALFLLIVILIKKRLSYFRTIWQKYRPLIAFITVLFTSQLLSFSFNLPGYLYLGRTVVYLLLLPFAIEHNKKTSPKLALVLGLSLLFVALFGLGQYFLYPDLRNLYYLGYDPHAYRLFGLFLDPNILGLVLVWAFFYFRFFLQSKATWAILVILLVALLLTYSRVSWIAFIAGLAYSFKSERKVALFLVITGFLGFGLFLLPRHFGEGTNLLRTNSLIGKLTSVKLVTTELGKQSWITGIGFNNIGLIQKGKETEQPDNSRYGLDNSLLTLYLTTGTMGVLAYLWLFGSLFKGANKFGKLLTLTYFVHALSVNSFFIPGIFVYYLLLRLSSGAIPQNSD